jgi:hypothetical protein
MASALLLAKAPMEKYALPVVSVDACMLCGRDAFAEAEHEVMLYQSLQELKDCDRERFPKLLASDCKGQPFPWMPLSFRGLTLARCLQSGERFERDTVSAVIRQLELALVVLHKHARILHLDLKPPNVLWCREQAQLQPIDMGMAEAIKDDFVPHFQSYVTQPYRPPELCNRSGPIAKFLAVGVDIWSFGCVVFEVATGVP